MLGALLALGLDPLLDEGRWKPALGGALKRVGWQRRAARVLERGEGPRRAFTLHED